MDESFEGYFSEGLPSLLCLAGAFVGDAGTAEEVVQDVLGKSSTQALHIVATGSQRAYLRRMVVNEHLSWRRKWAPGKWFVVPVTGVFSCYKVTFFDRKGQPVAQTNF